MPNKSGPNLSFYKFKSHVQTARESHDLNMDFCGFKQLRITNFMQEYCFIKANNASNAVPVQMTHSAAFESSLFAIVPVYGAHAFPQSPIK